MTTAIKTDADPGIGIGIGIGELVSLSSRLQRIVNITSAARIRLTHLDAQLTGVDWSGVSADAFRDRIGHLGKLADSYLAATDQNAGATSGPAQLASLHRDLTALADQRRTTDQRLATAPHKAQPLSLHNDSDWAHAWTAVTSEATSVADGAWPTVKAAARRKNRDVVQTDRRNSVRGHTTGSTAMKYICPSWGYPPLDDPPRSRKSGSGSYGICPSCGFEFGETHDGKGYTFATWRQKWIDDGRPWWSADFEAVSQGWDPGTQLRRLLYGSAEPVGLDE
jgi:predicted RNA-binding Zn-ribbon protein involved in translation (DUF1610 family)